MSTPEYFISCDWGTTNFRLRLVETSSLKVREEHTTDQGIKILHDKYLDQKNTDQNAYFADYLKEQILCFPAEHREHLIVSSGMSSSTIGLFELPYSDMPFNSRGGSLISKKVTFENGLNVLVISGVKSETGMMRGEEVQAIGFEDQLKLHGNGILILPGTHSKHITYQSGEFMDLKNFMTGELFDVLAKNSILSNSVKKGRWDSSMEEYFKEGVSHGLQGHLSSILLSIRVNDVINHEKKECNYFMLSGMLIGDELSYLKNSKDTIFLAAPASIGDLYLVALKAILDTSQVILFDDKSVEHALLSGQKKIMILND